MSHENTSDGLAHLLGQLSLSASEFELDIDELAKKLSESKLSGARKVSVAELLNLTIKLEQTNIHDNRASRSGTPEGTEQSPDPVTNSQTHIFENPSSHNPQSPFENQSPPVHTDRQGEKDSQSSQPTTPFAGTQFTFRTVPSPPSTPTSSGASNLYDANSSPSPQLFSVGKSPTFVFGKPEPVALKQKMKPKHPKKSASPNTKEKFLPQNHSTVPNPADLSQSPPSPNDQKSCSSSKLKPPVFSFGANAKPTKAQSTPSDATENPPSQPQSDFKFKTPNDKYFENSSYANDDLASRLGSVPATEGMQVPSSGYVNKFERTLRSKSTTAQTQGNKPASVESFSSDVLQEVFGRSERYSGSVETNEACSSKTVPIRINARPKLEGESVSGKQTQDNCPADGVSGNTRGGADEFQFSVQPDVQKILSGIAAVKGLASKQRRQVRARRQPKTAANGSTCAENEDFTMPMQVQAEDSMPQGVTSEPEFDPRPTFSGGKNERNLRSSQRHNGSAEGRYKARDTHEHGVASTGSSWVGNETFAQTLRTQTSPSIIDSSAIGSKCRDDSACEKRQHTGTRKGRDKRNVSWSIDCQQDASVLANNYRENARKLYGAANYTKAIECYDLSVKHAPIGWDLLPSVFSSRAAAFMMLEMYDRAIEDCERVLNLHPQQFVVWNRKGRAHFKSGDHDGLSRARECFNHVIHYCREPTTITEAEAGLAEVNTCEALLEEMELEFSSLQYRNAIKTAEEVMRRMPTFLRPKVVLLFSLDNMRRWEEVIELGERVARTSKQYRPSYNRLPSYSQEEPIRFVDESESLCVDVELLHTCVLCMGSPFAERYVAALRYGCPGVTPRQVTGLYQMLLDLCQRLERTPQPDESDSGQWGSSYAEFYWARTMSSSLSKLLDHKSKGDECFQDRRFAQAELYYTRALELDPEARIWNAVLACNRAAAKMEQGKRHDVIRDCEMALGYFPNYWRAHRRMAKAHRALYNFASASKEYRACLRLITNDEDRKEVEQEVRAMEQERRQHLNQMHRDQERARAAEEAHTYTHSRRTRQQGRRHSFGSVDEEENRRFNHDNARGSSRRPSCQKKVNTHYETLDISRGATDRDITVAYRKLALKWHPDKNKSDEAVDMFKLITEAYSILSDRAERRKYDLSLAL